MLFKLSTCLIAVISTAFIANSASSDDASKIVNMPPSKLGWEVTDEGVQFAALQGDRFSEAYMAMVRLPAGLVSPAHIKSANMYGLVVSGTISHSALDAGSDDEIALPAGSYYKIPSGLAHISRCISDVDCVTFLYQDGGFDFLPVEP